MDIREVRQWPLGDVVRLTFEDLDAAAPVELARLLQNETVVGGTVTVLTAWDSGTSAALDLGDSDTADAYLDGVDLTSTGVTEFTLTGGFYDAADALTATLAEAGTPATAGELVIQFTVLREGRGTETV